MTMFHPVDLGELLDFSLRIVLAFVLATAIGAERQFRQRSAGLRTNVLVAVGAASFVSLGLHLNGQAGASQIAAYVVSGIGFLGAGVIMKEGSHVWGLNTAATLWCSAAVGALCGVDLAAEAGILTVAVLAGIATYFPSRALSTDNAAMIAAAAYFQFQSHHLAGPTLNANPNLKLA